MAFCPNCGSRVTGRFCPNCGADIGAAASPSYTGAASSTSGLTDNVASALCYAFGFITGIIFLVLAPYNRNRTIRFHAWQSIFASAAIFAVDVLLGMVFAILHLYVVAGSLYSLFHLAVFIGWLYMMYSAYNRQKVVIPVIGPLAAKQA